MSFKPEDYNSVSPYFIVPEADRFIDMLKVVFDAEELRRYEHQDGSIMHAEVRIDDSVIMLGQASDEYPPSPIVIHVYVKDAEAVYHKAVEYGCESTQEPVQKDGDPDLRGSFKDYAGNWWSVGTQV